MTRDSKLDVLEKRKGELSGNDVRNKEVTSPSPIPNG